MSEPVVETQELAVRFGGVLAVDHVNFVLRERELRCLIGPNGAGKSTFFKSLTGQIRGANASGRVLIRGQDTSGWSTHQKSCSTLAKPGFAGLGGGSLVPSVTWPAAVHEGSGKWPVSLLPDERSYQARPTTAPRMTTTPMAIR